MALCRFVEDKDHFTRGLIRSNMHLFSVYYVWVCSRGMFPSRQNTDLAAIICLPCFSNSNSARLSCCCVSSLRIPRKGPFYLIPAPPEVVRCAVYRPMWQVCFPKSCYFSGSFHLASCELRVDFSFFSVFVFWYRTRKSYCPCLSLKSYWLEQNKSLLLHAFCSVISTRGLN